MVEIKHKPRVVIRADASIQIGSGHVMRCLTLADALRERGADVQFICRDLPGHLGGVLADKGYPVYWLPASGEDETVILAHTAHSTWLGVPWTVDVDQTQACLAGLSEIDWLIVDHYALDRAWELRMRPLVKRIMVIDDLADRPHDCDLLLDQNLHEEMECRYTELVPANCRQLLGPRYALLRPEFREVRKQLHQRDGVVRRILVFFGGSDPSNETAKALRAIRRLDQPDIAVDVVIGAANPHWREIEALCAKLPNTSFHRQVTNMAELMARADLAIGAGGVSTWERAVLAMPSLVIAVAENQIRVAEDWAATGGCWYLGHAEAVTTDYIHQVLQVLCTARFLAKAMSSRSSEYVDGRGVGRVAKIFMATQLVLRCAVPDDCRNLYIWRNDEVTRRYSGDGSPISWETHCLWFSKAIGNTASLLVIGEHDGRPVGVLRFDLKGKQATISVYLVPGNQGSGLGTALIEAGTRYVAQHVPQISEIIAQLSVHNQASKGAFEGAGYVIDSLKFRRTVKDSNDHW
ncbi:MAG: UDP-2,4-diacetamido-2,4,6-trideoxy-beta-L-altropyranose hydrolase [Candidatus Competibacteraceae bacterium]|nr:UDP-2,4-diacetamido-2,4,6-trideoxy-beta-L-altropyranose hydrolase [Candidatus Competibacteraceae bacterium]MCP5125058.1 UDP-2,4-diacetamido-2,4,6-trideoxy-beta-L-altropyranose hydrolase [Gammaproteobacteria bacterium]